MSKNGSVLAIKELGYIYATLFIYFKEHKGLGYLKFDTIHLVVNHLVSSLLFTF